MRLNDLPAPVQERILAQYPDAARGRRAPLAAGGRSELEEMLVGQLRAMRIPRLVREYRFDPLRRWRFDLAWPELMIAVEVDGGTRTAGRHVRGGGYERDCEKLNAAIGIYGWRVLRFTSTMVEDGRALATIEAVLQRVSAARSTEGGQ